MYVIQKTEYGYHLTFGGFIDKKEMKTWLKDSIKKLKNNKEEFSVFIDMRTLLPLPEGSKKYMIKGQKYYKKKGMKRSVVILNDTSTTIQFIRIAKETGIYDWERYIDASKTDWEKAGMDWIVKGIDPD
ncbi:MAG: hypothetical protein JXB50_09065 [Spirochaetes bacterium]|nr:hypothetical protein [Spirochaetota bacterium]